MLFPYPTLKKEVSIYEYKDGDQTVYTVETWRGEYEISEEMADFLVNLEGAGGSPYCCPALEGVPEAQVDALLEGLMRRGLLRRGRRVAHYTGPFFLLRLAPLPLVPGSLVNWITLLLMVLGPLSLAAAAALLPLRLSELSWEMENIGLYGYLLVLLGLMVSILLHELGHGVSAVSFRGHVCELGLFCLLCLPMGMYVSHTREWDNRVGDYAVAAAGIAANAILAVLCLLACDVGGWAGGVLLQIGINNLMLVLVNLLPASLTDGGAVLEALSGIPEIHQKALRFFLSRRERARTVREMGRVRTLGRALLYLLALAGQLALFVLLAREVLILLSLFFGG